MGLMDTLAYVLAGVWLMAWLSYAIPQLYLKFMKPQNLKEKYNAEWALVTGGSTGIGRAIVEKLAAQDLNIVVVAFPDAHLDKAIEELTAKFPKCKFIKVGLNLADRNFMETLAKETKDIKVSILINNAGYIKTGFFAESDFKGQLANHDVNATAAMEITHHYVEIMRENKLRGCVTFTSSPAGFMATPYTVLYGATKAYLTTFAQSLAPEIYSDGIDVAVLHPSPVASNFYDSAHKIDAIAFFKSTATGPEVLADILLASVGRVVTIDQGYYPVCVKLLLKIIDGNFIADAARLTASYLPDFKKMKADIAAAKAKAK
ncbi:Very-long-chain 3-oxoacyl-CoA reductase [Hondaea fermentalgiana]|uniref:Very-long-chain 3-oxoacyl-CoA reductase n=1 Tax=Hondaea fermentalgiana TaxID=2315210 RepID=A0A2R5FZH0_9STRA|nr:Very-long-chain 3-oxoacyl-CoA reductase [Hondaea fermentalgiana]|eukprot:GBG24130.1 Very-long-chain 3-oxoacyl-CoA reductase [Hondaea fermentalgiana]